MSDLDIMDGLLSIHSRQLIRQRSRVIRTGDREAVHDLRVATRRLQEVIDFCGDALPHRPARRLARRARRIRRELGPLRNSDVLRELVARFSKELNATQRRSLAPVERGLASDAATLRRPGDKDGARGTRKGDARMKAPGVRKRIQALRRGPRLPASFSLRKRASEVLEDRTVTLEAALWEARTGRPAALHALRIRIKRYRYALEILARAGIRKARPAIVSARSAQTSLGEVHDLDVFLELLRHRKPSASGRALIRLFTQRRRQMKDTAVAALASFEPRRITGTLLAAISKTGKSSKTRKGAAA